MIRFVSLKYLLMDNLFVPVSQKNGRYFVRLKETGADAKLKQVDILDIPEGSMLIKLDQVAQPKSIFKGSCGERQCCDYVLVTALRNRPLLVFFEMKSRVVKSSEVTKQFKGAECLLDYCNAALNRFHGQSDLLAQCEKRFIVFYKSSIAKRRTQPLLPDHGNNSPESFLKYSDPQNPSIMALVTR